MTEGRLGNGEACGWSLRLWRFLESPCCSPLGPRWQQSYHNLEPQKKPAHQCCLLPFLAYALPRRAELGAFVSSATLPRDLWGWVFATPKELGQRTKARLLGRLMGGVTIQRLTGCGYSTRYGPNACRSVPFLNEVAALYRGHTSLTLPVLPWFLVYYDQRSVYAFHWTLPPTSLMCCSCWRSQVLEAPRWPHSALFRILSTIVPFSVHVPSAVAGHRDPATQRLHLPMQYWWVGQDSQRRDISSATALLWDSPTVPPPPPWNTGRRLWVLSYGRPERSMVLYVPHAHPLVNDHVSLRAHAVGGASAPICVH
uniref:Uncharacterized protein n=1 Tax=Eutreptiella gymnastica TaxID=73025 RepID=A0A7S4LFF8_9EUGL